jgi:hypothetical protein
LGRAGAGPMSGQAEPECSAPEVEDVAPRKRGDGCGGAAGARCLRYGAVASAGASAGRHAFPARRGGAHRAGDDRRPLPFRRQLAGRLRLQRSGGLQLLTALERRARRVDVGELEPGDLLFFDLEGKKNAHVAIYVGEESFVHAPSTGRRVERVAFDHVYWGPRIERAGRLSP